MHPARAAFLAAILLHAGAVGCGDDDGDDGDDGGGSPDAAAAPDAAPPDAPAAAGGDAAPPPTWSGFARPFFQTYCWACHGPGDALRDYSQLPMVMAEAAKIRCGVAPTELPGCGPGLPAPNQFPVGSGPRPSEAERLTLVQWIDEGMPE